MEKDIIENNRLIAEFMGGKPCNRCKDCGMYIFEDGSEHFEKYLDYHKSYDRLMPVVEKIYLIREVEINMTLGSLEIVYISEKSYRKNICIPTKTGLECWWLSVVEFIKWYNGKNKS